MKISVYIASYNQSQYLNRAIESVLAQTLLPQEIIIIDDHSSDDSPLIIEAYATKYPHLIKAIYHSQNTGIAQVRNEAVQLSQQDYISYVDADDWYAKEKLEQEAEKLSNDSRLDFVYSNYAIVDSEEQFLRFWSEEETIPEGYIFPHVVGGWFPKSNLFRYELVSRQAILTSGAYDSHLKIYEDDDFRIRLSHAYQAGYCPIVGSYYRKNLEGLSKSDHMLHFESLYYIFSKNQHLIKTLDMDLQKRVLSAFSQRVAYRAEPIIDNLMTNRFSILNRFEALQYYWRLRKIYPKHPYLRLLAKILLP